MPSQGPPSGSSPSPKRPIVEEGKEERWYSYEPTSKAVPAQGNSGKAEEPVPEQSSSKDSAERP